MKRVVIQDKYAVAHNSIIGTIMKSRMLVTLALLMLVAAATFAQTLGARTAVANQSWPRFWQQFTDAVNRKDHEALLKVMPDDFFDGGGGSTAGEWLQFVDSNEKNGSWKNLKKSFARGTLIKREWSSKGTPTRVTRDNGYYFEFRKDKRWYFAGVVGD
jgi:hypothetical protein